MIENYLREYHDTLNSSIVILNYKLETKIINDFLLILEGSAETEIRLLDFVEVLRYDGVEVNKKKYKYNFRSFNSKLIFRFDNAPHYPKIKSFPHHLHSVSEVFESVEPTIYQVLQKIKKHI